MLTMEDAIRLIRSEEKQQWLTADWNWYSDSKGHGGIYIGIVRGEACESCLDCAGWTVGNDDGLISISLWNDEKNVRYSYGPASGESWPIIIHRNFYGIEEDQYDVLEEFRLFHNLWHDRKADNYYKILEDGSKQKIVFRNEQGAILVDTVALRQYCCVRGVKIVQQFDVLEAFNERQEENSERVRDSHFCFDRCVINDSCLGTPAFGRLLGKRLIEALPLEKSGLFEFKRSKQYQSFIIGSKDDGQDELFSSDPDGLANCFGKNPDAPNYLTPVHFKKDVLKKYIEKPSVYSVEDGYLRCGSLWGIKIDNDHEDKVMVFLGDLGRDLPETEQIYWRSFNIRPDAKRVSETCFRRSFLAEFADPETPEFTLRVERNRLLKKWREAFGFDLYSDFHKDDRGILSDLRHPISDEWGEFDRCTLAAAKIFIDYLNESEIERSASIEIKRMREINPKKSIRGIDKLQAWFLQNGEGCDFQSCIASLRLLQELRSKSSAHRKSSSLTELLDKKGMGDASPRDVYRQLVLIPLIDCCKRLANFAEERLPH